MSQVSVYLNILFSSRVFLFILIKTLLISQRNPLENILLWHKNMQQVQNFSKGLKGEKRFS